MAVDRSGGIPITAITFDSLDGSATSTLNDWAAGGCQSKSCWRLFVVVATACKTKLQPLWHPSEIQEVGEAAIW